MHEREDGQQDERDTGRDRGRSGTQRQRQEEEEEDAEGAYGESNDSLPPPPPLPEEYATEDSAPSSRPSTAGEQARFAPGSAQRFGGGASRAVPGRSPPRATHLGQKARRALSRSPSRNGPGSGTARRSMSRSSVRPARAASSTRAVRSSSSTRAAALAPARTSTSTGASTSRYSRAAIAAEIERERAELCPFTPSLISKPLLEEQGTMADRLAVWEARRDAALSRKLQQKREYEEEKLAECTFAPTINPQSAAAVAAAAAAAAAQGGQPRAREPVAERLHHEADHRAQLRDRARRLNEEELLASLPFAPRICEGSRKALDARAQKPLYQRVAELQKRKNERQHAALLAAREAELAGGAPPADGEVAPPLFKPRINPVSEKLAAQREAKERAAREEALAQQGQGAGGEASTDPTASGSSPRAAGGVGAAASARLAGPGSSAALAARLRHSAVHAAHAASEHTFKPELNPVSERLLAKSRLFAGPSGKDFLTRQERLQALSREAAAERAQAEAKATEFTFTPDIGNAEAVLQASRARQQAALAAAGAPPEVQLQAAQPEDAAAQASRLSNGQARELTLLKSKLRALHAVQQGLTFTPEISAVSRRLAEQRAAQQAAAGGIEAENESRRMAAQLLAQKQAAAFAQEHPFKPALSAASQEMAARGLVGPHYSARDPAATSAQIRDDAEERAQKLAAMARAAEAVQLSECTFDPAAVVEADGRILGRVPKQPKAPVLVRGMNRFLELKALHKRQEAEQAERERKVFMLDIVAGPTSPGTAGGAAAAAADAHVATTRPGGYTIPRPFTLSHEERQAQREAHLARVHREADQRLMAECKFQPATTQAQHRHLIQSILHDDDDCGRGDADTSAQ